MKTDSDFVSAIPSDKKFEPQDCNQIMDSIRMQWANDCSISDELDKELTNIPRLHSKYSGWLYKIKQMIRAVEKKIVKLEKLKTRYYMGEMSKQELDYLRWPQYQKKTPLKTELEKIIKQDDDMQDLIDIRLECESAKDFIESCIKELNSRGYNIKAAIDYKRFMSGA